jgi:hypothetical protein
VGDDPVPLVEHDDDAPTAVDEVPTEVAEADVLTHVSSRQRG